MTDLPTPEASSAENALAKAFDPQTVEPSWATRWKNEPFRADASSGKPPSPS